MNDSNGYDCRYSEDMDKHVEESGRRERRHKKETPYWDTQEAQEAKQRIEAEVSSWFAKLPPAPKTNVNCEW